MPLEDELYRENNEYENKLNFIIDNKLSNERRRIQNLEKVLSLNSPSSKIVNAYLEIDNLKDKIEKIMAFKIKSNKQKIFSLNNMLNAHNPINILKRGYAIIEDENDKLIKSKDFFDEKKKIKIYMEDGYVVGNFIPVEGGIIMAKKESYNEMLENLEGILSTLENDELSLEDAMKEYEKGSKIVNKLYKTLDTLEGKFLTIKENSEVVRDNDV